MDRAGEKRDVGSASADAALGRAFAEIAPNAPFVIYQLRVRPDGSYQFPIVSSGFQDLFGIQPGDGAGRGTALSRVHAEDRKALLDGILEVHRTLEPWHGEFRVLSPHGEVWVEGRSAGRREPDGSSLWFGVLFDVTERKRIEEALRDSREAFASILEATFDFYWEIDAEGRYTLVSPNVTSTLGYSPEELLGKTPFGLMSEEEATEGRRLLQEYAQRRVPFVAESLRRHKDGHFVALKSSGIPKFGPDGALLGFRGVTRDVTERRQAVQALRDRETKYRAAVDSSQDAFLIVDSAGRILEVNDACTRMTGYTRGELAAIGLRGFADEPPETTAAHIEMAIREGGVVFESRVRKKDGSVIPVEVAAAFRPFDGGRLFSFIRDISERRSAEQNLRDREAQLRQITETVPLSIAYVDMNGRYRWVNGRYEELFGIRLGDVRGRHLREVLGDEFWKTVLPHFERVLAGEAQQFEAEIPPGGNRWFALTQTPERDAAGHVTGYVAMATDITAERRAVAQRIHLEEQLRQSQKMEAVGQLAGGVAHDFNNLLTVISGNSEFLLSEVPSPTDIRTFVGEIQNAANRAAGLTRQLLAFSRRQVLKPAPVDLNEIVAGSEKLLRRLLGEDIVFTTILDRHLGRFLADPGQMEQVLLNLSVNARDAMPTGGRLTIETRDLRLPAAACGAVQSCTAETACSDARRVQLVVADSGCGMSSDVRSRAFDPFFTTKPAGKGTGLGLATVYGIVRQSGGEIFLESTPGTGTTFRICLPVLEREASARTEETLAPPAGGRETILAVEDEDAVRRIVRLTLESQGYTVLEARDGAEALDVAGLHDGPIELLVTDVVMPSMSGPALARILRARRPETRVIYVSGYTDDAVLRHGIAAGEDRLLQKPFSPLSLLRKVRETLDGASPGPGSADA